MSRTKRSVGKYFFRYPKTQNERRLIASALEQGVKVRAKRNVNNLPDSHDELIVGAQLETPANI